ncbi:hypothetical protein HAX54_050806 [Datura stramonium]|uniref:Uncharacterized protein n=1 Tax=Datura stramonium TaxID=4076 RepID=A0ABS8WNU1_DATST|nr:hypothetical protein [Datura stramonium]
MTGAEVMKEFMQERENLIRAYDDRGRKLGEVKIAPKKRFDLELAKSMKSTSKQYEQLIKFVVPLSTTSEKSEHEYFQERSYVELASTLRFIKVTSSTSDL